MGAKKLSDRKVRGIQRRIQTVDPRTVFHIFSEGEKTEPSYLRALFAKYPKIPVELDLVAPAGVPETVASKAIAARCKLRLENEELSDEAFEGGDQFWAVFDCDSESARFNAAKDRCEKSSVHLACSDPCFELWLILHFGDYDRGGDQAEVQVHLREYCPEYHPINNKVVNFEKLWPSTDDAIRRSARQIAARQKDGADRPQTTFGSLVNALREHAKPIGRVALEPLAGINLTRNTVKKRHGRK